MANYGSMDEEKGRLVGGDQHDVALNVLGDDFFPDNPFAEVFDSDFWSAVDSYYQEGESGKTWTQCLTEVRVNLFIEKHKQSGKDVFVILLEDVYDNYKKEALKSNKMELMPSLIQQLSEFAFTLINDDYQSSKETGKKAVYSKPLKCSGTGIKKTALHLACERNLVAIAARLLELYPGQLYVKSNTGEGHKQIPVEPALKAKLDDVSSVLVKSMLNERVRELFEYDKTLGKAKFSFIELAKDTKMKKTVLAILDCLINPDFPFVPVQPGETKEGAWEKIPDLPMRYHIHYQILDGDENGRPARIKDTSTGKYVYNKDFNHKTQSGLYVIANCPYNEDIISHPAVRLLIRRKWSLFGRMRSRKFFLLYLFYLLTMSLAFFIPVEKNDRSVYQNHNDYIRAVCEIITLIVAVVYLVSEVDQMMKEKMEYWKDVYNILDLLGLSLIFIIPCVKFTTVSSYNNNPSAVEWSVASFAFLINFFRMYKYFTTFKMIGVYAKTFVVILQNDITKFLTVFIVVLIGFTGSVYLAINAEANGLSKAGLNLYSIFLQEVRAMAETNGFADDYVSVFRIAVILLLMINMFVIIVVLSNILIGQISYRFEKANESAYISYDVDRTKAVTRMENSRWVQWNERIKHYIDGDFITEGQVIEELLEDWERLTDRRQNTSAPSHQIRSMMGSIMKKMHTE